MENSSQTDTPLEERCYNRAMACFKEREYEVAYRLFQLLGDYKDARQKSEEAKQAHDKKGACQETAIIVYTLLVVLAGILIFRLTPYLLYLFFKSLLFFNHTPW